MQGFCNDSRWKKNKIANYALLWKLSSNMSAWVLTNPHLAGRASVLFLSFETPMQLNVNSWPVLLLIHPFFLCVTEINSSSSKDSRVILTAQWTWEMRPSSCCCSLSSPSPTTLQPIKFVTASFMLKWLLWRKWYQSDN